MYDNIRIEGRGDTVTVIGPCVACEKEITVADVPADAYRQYRDGELAQRCFPNMNLDDREFLISGVCKACFEDMFKESEDLEELYEEFDPPYTVSDIYFADSQGLYTPDDDFPDEDLDDEDLP